MRTFHTGGVAGGDITQGLPRVEELFEARKPKKMATLAEIGGTVRFEEATKGSLLNIIVTADDGETRTYCTCRITGLQVEDGDVIEKGKQLQRRRAQPARRAAHPRRRAAVQQLPDPGSSEGVPSAGRGHQR